MRRAMLSVLVVAIAGLALGASGCPKTSKAGFPMVPMAIAGERVQVELVVTDAQRSRGLMYRRTMKDNRGMLFVYPKKERLSFWMKNTFIPLTIAFIADDGTIVHLEDMAPQTLLSHQSPKAVRYALEMNKGWFSKRGIEVGAKAEFEIPLELDVQ